MPQKLCVLDELFILKDYSGKKNETEFIKYIDSKNKDIEWWFKNGNKGQDYFAIKYFDTTENKEALFYPDWIILFKDGRMGIFDTKKDETAVRQETIDKAKSLALKIEKLGKNFVGGIVVFENGVWYYNNSENYSYQKGKISENKDWKPFEILFK
jgi:type III restriction enzyme